ncbi:MAG: hypothetical protein QXI61_05055 [Nitrososphaerota archaeon]
MKNYLAMYLHPWDLIDEGPEAVLSTMHEMGLTHINLATSYHCGRYILPHNPNKLIYFAEEGVVYFTPTPEYYKKTKLRPRRSQKYREYDVLKIAIDNSRNYGLSINSWTVCLHNYEHVRSNPDVAVRDPLGNIDENFMCPNNPDAREYVKGLVSNLASNYDLNMIQLESVAFPWGVMHFDHHETFGTYIDPLLSYLFSTCYCDNCEEKAKEYGINFSDIRKRAREIISKIISYPTELFIKIPESDVASRLYEYLIRDDTLNKLLEFKSTTSSEIVQEIRENVRSINPKVKLSVITGATMWINEGFNLRKISKIVDAIDYICYFENPYRIENHIRILRENTEEKCWVIPSLRTNYPIIYTEDNLYASINAAINAGADGISLYNYGWTPKTIFSWIKTAIAQIKHSLD